MDQEAVADTVLYEVNLGTVAAIIGAMIAIVAILVIFVNWLRKEE